MLQADQRGEAPELDWGLNMDLDKALEIAVKAHAGQKDKVGEPYILHPLRITIRTRMERYQKAYRFLTGRSFKS